MTTYATKKISERTDAGVLNGAEIFPLIRTGSTVDYKSTLSAVFTYITTDATFLTLLEDNFAEHIVEGYDAVLGATTVEGLQADDTLVKDLTLFRTGETTRWEFTTDADGNCYLKPNAADTSGDNILALNPQGDVQAGNLAYRTLIRSLQDNAYAPTGGEDNSRCLRMLSSNGSSNVTVTINRDADVAVNDRFFTNDFLLIQRQTTGTLTIVAGHADVTITNEYTGVAGSVTVNQKGGYVLLRRTGTNTYVASGDIPKRAVETVVSVASEAGVLTLDWALGNAFTTTLTENITSIVYSNLPSGVAQSILLTIVQHASSPKTVDGWAAGTLWQGGVAPTITATNSAVDRVSLSCNGANSTVLGDFGLAYA